MHFKLLFLLIAVLIFTLPNVAFAHTSEVVGDYKIEIGWVNEPPIAKVPNAIEIFVTEATETELTLAKIHEAEHKEGGGHDDHDTHDDANDGHDHSSHGGPAFVAKERQGNEAYLCDISIQGPIYCTVSQEDLPEHREMPLDKSDYRRFALLAYLDPGDINFGTEPIWEITPYDGILGDLHQVILVENVGEISADKAIRVLNEIVYKNKANTEFPELISNASDILYRVDTGKLHRIDGLKEIDALIQKIIEQKERESIGDEIIGISGLANKLEVNVKIKDSKTFLDLIEDPDFPGRYVADFTPPYDGTTFVNVFVGTIGDKEIEIKFRPESVEPGDTPLPKTPTITAADIVCESHLVLMKKITGDSIACIEPTTAKILVERGWGIIIEN